MTDESATIDETAQARLKSFIERIENLEEEKAVLTKDIAEIYSEAKGVGFNTKVLKLVIKERKKTPEERQEEDVLFTLYLQAVGMIG